MSKRLTVISSRLWVPMKINDVVKKRFDADRRSDTFLVRVSAQ